MNCVCLCVCVCVRACVRACMCMQASVHVLSRKCESKKINNNNNNSFIALYPIKIYKLTRKGGVRVSENVKWIMSCITVDVCNFIIWCGAFMLAFITDWTMWCVLKVNIPTAISKQTIKFWSWINYIEAERGMDTHLQAVYFPVLYHIYFQSYAFGWKSFHMPVHYIKAINNNFHWLFSSDIMTWKGLKAFILHHYLSCSQARRHAEKVLLTVTTIICHVHKHIDMVRKSS